MSASLPACVLAAGGSRRFGPENKLLHTIDGGPLVVRALAPVLACPLDPVWVVLGHEADRVRAAIEERFDDPRLRFASCPDWQEGRNRSLHRALAEVGPEAPGLLVQLGDLPSVPPELVAAVIEAFRRSGRISFPWVDGKKGHPTAWPRAQFARLRSLEGDDTFSSMLAGQPELCERVEWPDPAVLRDIDLRGSA